MILCVATLVMLPCYHEDESLIQATLCGNIDMDVSISSHDFSDDIQKSHSCS